MNSCLKKLAVAAAVLWSTSVAAEMLPGSEWAPTELNGENFAPLSKIFLQFDQDGRYFGNGGCNTFRGSFVTNEDAILFSPAATTRMACPEDIMQQEFDVLQALMKARYFSRDGIRLELMDQTGAPLLGMVQRDAD